MLCPAAHHENGKDRILPWPEILLGFEIKLLYLHNKQPLLKSKEYLIKKLSIQKHQFHLCLCSHNQ
jgi:hypothetical protein